MSQVSRTRALVLSRPAIIVALAVAFLLIVATALLTAASTRGTVAAEKQATHAEVTFTAATKLVLALGDSSTAARSYLATRDEKFLTDYRAARERQQEQLARLTRQLAEDGDALRLLELTRKSTEVRFANFDRALATLRAEGPNAALAAFDASDNGRAVEDASRLVLLLQRQEFSELTEHSSVAAGRAEIIRALNLGLVVTAVALGTGVVWWLLRRMRELEGLITVCAWTRRVKWQGRWMSFEEYLAKRFNLYCTHGICEEAAERMRREAEATPVAESWRDDATAPLPPRTPVTSG
jgi:CHASE3 domain sensor protein